MKRNEANRFAELLYDSTTGQRRLTLLVGVIAIALAGACAGLTELQWTGWQWALVLFVAFDLGGGVAAMCLLPAIRKIRPPDEPLRPILFSAFHIHPLFLALVLPQQEWTPMFMLYGAGVAGVAAASLAPIPYRASIALAWCALALPIIPFFGAMPGLAWLAPAYLLKLVGSCAVAAPWEERP